ncbi:Phenylacetaldehyde oxime monooxygenase CYP71AN24, partial [Cucurbita argyrosperma subsp. sororia]
MGKKFEDENGNNRFRDVSRRVIELLSAFCVADFFPAFGWVDVVRGFIGELKTISRTMDEFLDMVIEEHKTELRTGRPDDKRDFLDIMLQLNQDDMLGYHFTRDNLKAILQSNGISFAIASFQQIFWFAWKLPNSSVLDVEEENGLPVCKKPPASQVTDIVREIFKNHDISFSNRPKSTAANLFFYGYKDVGFSPYGEYWRGLKKICTLELLSQRRVHEFQYVREEEVEILVNKVHKASSSGLSVNLSELITSTSNNIVSRCIFGEKFEDENGKSRFGELTRRMAKLVVAFSVGDFYPAFGWIDNITGLIGQLKETSRALDTFLEQLIEEHKTKKNGDFQGDREDFVDILLQVQQKDDLGFEFTQESLKSVLEVFFFPTRIQTIHTDILSNS